MVLATKKNCQRVLAASLRVVSAMTGNLPLGSATEMIINMTLVDDSVTFNIFNCKNYFHLSIKLQFNNRNTIYQNKVYWKVFSKACLQALVSVIINIGEIKNKWKTRLTWTEGMFTGWWESCYFHMKLQFKTETSNRNFQHQLETSNLQRHYHGFMCFGCNTIVILQFNSNFIVTGP